MSSYAAYIDESGNHDLSTDKQGASRYFLVLAVLIPRGEIPYLEAAVEAIRSKHFGVGEIKSSNVKDDRRQRIIEELTTLNFQFYAVAVDKERVNKDSGLTYKRSFIKFANGMLYSAIFRQLLDVTIFADAHGSPEFSESFVKYVNETHTRDLFTNNIVQMVDSKSHVLVQLADFLVGTTAKLYENKCSPQLREVLLKFLISKRIRVDEWPPRFELRGARLDMSSETDAAVRDIAFNSAAQFLEKYSRAEDVESRAQLATLSFLLFRVMFAAHDDYIPAHEIVEHLSHHGFQDISPYFLRSNIVAKLRDKDVVIASSTRGYKIPTSYADIYGYAELVDGIASPLLARLKRAHSIFELGSVGKIKILEEPRFQRLRLMLSSLEDSSI